MEFIQRTMREAGFVKKDIKRRRKCKAELPAHSNLL